MAKKSNKVVVNAKPEVGYRVIKALIKIDNGPGKTTVHPTTGEVTSRTYAPGEKGVYMPGDILPESVVRQLRKLDHKGNDTRMGEFYEEKIASEGEMTKAEREAEAANIVAPPVGEDSDASDEEPQGEDSEG